MTAFAIKLIAIIGMAIDHVGAVFPEEAPGYFRLIGRFVFPVFAYMIAQGCKHTKSIWKYALRLGVFALVSEAFFDLAVKPQIDFIRGTNVFYTLFLAVVCIAVYEKLRTMLTGQRGGGRKQEPTEAGDGGGHAPTAMDDGAEHAPNATGDSAEHAPTITDSGQRYAPPVEMLAFLPIIPIAALGLVLSTDYGWLGVACVLVFYFSKPENRLTRGIATSAVAFLIYGIDYFTVMRANRGLDRPVVIGGIDSFTREARLLNMFLAALAAVPLLCLYNGKQGPKIKWAFYVFYPAHLAVLAAVRYLAV
jgi:hypothetical protein